MLDNRIYTFLELCTVMHYHKTAENLAMTQPAVTQHIQYLENLYHCKLFQYRNKKLYKTEQGIALENYARSIVSFERSARAKLSATEKTVLNIGATKTIGEYFLAQTFVELLRIEDYEINLIIDNTERLLDRLNHFAADILLLEGYVDKEKYQCQAFAEEELIGICAKTHPFAGQEVTVDDIFTQHIVLREEGSGTRAVFEHFLTEQGYSVEMFRNKSVFSSNKLIEHAVQEGLALSFVYRAIPKQNKKLATFRLKGSKLLHTFHYVFLHDKKLEELQTLLAQIKA